MTPGSSSFSCQLITPSSRDYEDSFTPSSYGSKAFHVKRLDRDSVQRRVGSPCLRIEESPLDDPSPPPTTRVGHFT
jgi:hypothetical protein